MFHVFLIPFTILVRAMSMCYIFSGVAFCKLTHAHYFLPWMSSEFLNKVVNCSALLCAVGSCAIEKKWNCHYHRRLTSITNSSNSGTGTHTHKYRQYKQKRKTNWKNCIELTTHSVLCTLALLFIINKVTTCHGIGVQNCTSSELRWTYSLHYSVSSHCSSTCSL